jgi:hypothetical protein
MLRAPHSITLRDARTSTSSGAVFARWMRMRRIENRIITTSRGILMMTLNWIMSRGTCEISNPSILITLVRLAIRRIARTKRLLPLCQRDSQLSTVLRSYYAWNVTYLPIRLQDHGFLASRDCERDVVEVFFRLRLSYSSAYSRWCRIAHRCLI